jgi:hypothetical protein
MTMPCLFVSNNIWRSFKLRSITSHIVGSSTLSFHFCPIQLILELCIELAVRPPLKNHMIKDPLSTKFFKYRCEHIEHCNSKMWVVRSSWKHYHRIVNVACNFSKYSSWRSFWSYYDKVEVVYNFSKCSRECKKVWRSEPLHFQVNSLFGRWSPGGLLNLQKTIVGAKTQWLEEFIISLKALGT